MTDETAPRPPAAFDERLWPHEEQIITLLNQFGAMAGRTPATSTVRALFYLHHQLTQAETRRLARKYLQPRLLRGYSAGSISTILNKLEAGPVPFVTRTTIAGTNEYLYTLTRDLETFLVQSVPLLRAFVTTLAGLVTDLDARLADPALHALRGYDQVRACVREFHALLPRYEEIVASIDGSLDARQQGAPGDARLVAYMKTQIANLPEDVLTIPAPAYRFPPPIAEIERTIHAYFLAREYLGENRPATATRVLAFFYTRQELTQEDLRALTGLSAGKISEEVRNLQEAQVVTAERVPGDRAIHYRLQHLPRALTRFLLKTQEVFFAGADQLRAIARALEGDPALQSARGYAEIHGVVRGLLRFTAAFERLQDRLVA